MSNDESIQRFVDHYFDAEESSRLRTGWFQLEHARTQELILRHLPPAPATIIDAGGGAGTYACWLAARGYQVHLIDPMPKHVEQARARRPINANIHWLRQKLETRATWHTQTPAQTQFCSSVRSIILSRGNPVSPVCAKPAAFCAREV